MGTISSEEYSNGIQSNYDRQKELKAFDDTKMGVKGVVDSGAKTLPKIFIRPPDELSEEQDTPCVKLQIPVIDLEGIEKKNYYDKIVKEVVNASESWGFFQVINHGIPLKLMDDLLQGIKEFHEQDADAKKVFYTRDMSKQVLYSSNYDLYNSKAANWRDTLSINIADSGHLDPNDIPEICRNTILEYSQNALKLGEKLLELLSVGLGLSQGYLNQEIECNKGWSLVNHYYPACPAPELTMGTSKHTDPSFLTILLQDQIGGLQVLHQNQWVEVQPRRGAIVINIGDILQVLSNDRLKSVFHRVTANHIGPRISSALFFSGENSSPKMLKPIKEVVSEENPAVYREFTLAEFRARFFSRPLNESNLEYWKLSNRKLA